MMKTSAWHFALFALVSLLVPLQAAATGRCDAGGIYAAETAAAREAVRARCDCATATSHAAYVGCAWDVIQELSAAGQLPRVCRGRVHQFASDTTCGRDDVVACCVKRARGPWRATIARKQDGCQPAPNAVAWCEAAFPELEYACDPQGSCRTSVCGDGILDRASGEGCEPPGVGLCDQWCQPIICGNGKIDPGEECEPPRTATCDPICHDKKCGDGIVEPENEECEPPGTPTCDDQCYTIHACGNGVIDAGWGEQCEPPGTATCNATCQFIHTCGNGIIEPGEECDGQAGCTDGCTLGREVCCEVGDSCIDGTASDEFDAYFTFFKPCAVIVAGRGSYGSCVGTQACPPPAPPDVACVVGSCGDHPIDPLLLCCNEPDGTCHDTVATTAAAIGGFDCSALFPLPNVGDVPRMMLGACGANGRCVPMN